MLKRISAYLLKNPGVKAKVIASYFGKERSEINHLLYAHPELFEQGSEFEWSLIPPKELQIDISGGPWVTARDFEKALCSGPSPLESDFQSVKFVLKDGCKLLLDALARLLAMCNQLAEAGKQVILDFDGSKKTLTYLDRLGFFDHLSAAARVEPRRPKGGLSKAYRGNNHGVVELRSIAPLSPDQEIPKLLQNSFVSCTGDSYSVAAFTVLSELFGNVVEHSGATTAGFAGLQFYRGANHIQAVISDNGLGIVGTLNPILKKLYPAVAKKIAASGEHPGVALLQEIFSAGGISQVGERGRGLGLKRSGELAEQYRAKISVRQTDFELRINQQRGQVTFSHSANLARLDGTHICFDFQLDAPHNSR